MVETGTACFETYQLRCPVKIALAHRLAYALISSSRGDQEATIADVTAPSGIIGLDVEAPQTQLIPVCTSALHFIHRFNATNVPKDHDGTKVSKPVLAKSLKGHGVNHGIGVSTLDFLVEIVAEICQ
jgi:hypothetical protein